MDFYFIIFFLTWILRLVFISKNRTSRKHFISDSMANGYKNYYNKS